MIPTDIEERKRLVQFVAAKLAADWYCVDPAKVWKMVPYAPVRTKFEKIAIDLIDLIDGYSPKTPEPVELPGVDKQYPNHYLEENVGTVQRDDPRKNRSSTADLGAGMFDNVFGIGTNERETLG